MKKKYIFLLLIVALLLGSCAKKNMPCDKLYPCSYTGTLTFEGLEYHLGIQIDKKGVAQIEFNSPSELMGTKYRVDGDEVTLVCDDVEVIVPASENNKILRLARCFCPDKKDFCSVKEAESYKLYTYSDKAGKYTIKLDKENKLSEIKAMGSCPYSFKTKKV